VVAGSIPSQLAGAIEFTPTKYTGSVFAANVIQGTKMCRATFHVCNAWEYSTISILGQNAVAQGYGWLVGGFNNQDIHIRALVDGLNSPVCPVNSHLIAYTRCCQNEPGWGGYFGRMHCEPDASIFSVTCCRDNLLGGL